MSREVLFDVDGVVADFISHSLDFLNKISESMGDEPLYHEGMVSSSFDMSDWVNPKHLDSLWDIMSRPEFWLTIPVFPEAKEGIQRIRDRGLKVFWVSKPSRYCPLWQFARAKWLEEHFSSDYHDLIPAKHKYLIQGARFFDDRIENVTAWEQRNPGGLAYLFNTPQNAGVVRTQRVSWETIETAL